jgi:hypothetical protein
MAELGLALSAYQVVQIAGALVTQAYKACKLAHLYVPVLASDNFRGFA